MTRYQVVLRIRPLPWPIWVLRRLRQGPIDRMSGATSSARPEIWFALLVPDRWRAVHRWYADRHRYFWLPCALCGRGVGGHERAYLTDLPATVPDPTNPPLLRGICPRCTRAGRGVAS
jgi:hypothetical protein